MEMPYGEVNGKSLSVSFSTADYSVATVMAALREHLDVLDAMEVKFLGCQTDVPRGPTPVFQPVPIKAMFEHVGKGDARPALEKTYELVWRGMVATFPREAEWAQAKQAFSDFVVAQADLLRARADTSRPPQT